MALKIKDIIRGNTRAINLTFTNADGTPADLTGATVSFAATSVDSPTTDDAAAIDVSTATHTAPTLGQSRIVLSATDTKVTPGTYNCGAQAVLADGTVIEDTGKLKIKPEFKVGLS